jgi:hypothetical protein
VGLEACDTLGFASLANCVNCVTNTDLSLDRFQIFVKGDQHTRVDRQRQVEKEVVVLPSYKCLHVGGSNKHREQASERDI